MRCPLCAIKHPCTLISCLVLRLVCLCDPEQAGDPEENREKRANLAMAVVAELRPAAASELVTLFVGGVAFETTRTTLTSVPDSALA